MIIKHTELKALPEFLKKIPIWYARKFQVLVVVGEQPTDKYLLFSNEEGRTKREDLQRIFFCHLEPIQTDSVELTSCINRSYQTQNSLAEQQIEQLDEGESVEELLSARDDLLDDRNRAPMIRLVNSILNDAVKSGVSDVHIQPYETELVVRFRIDGILKDQFTIPKSAQEEVISRVKILGKMDIAEKRLPQDGRASVAIGEKSVDLRIASLPTNYGERIVIRLLDKTSKLFSLTELGMTPEILEPFGDIIRQEHGIFLVTGPTGSGKSTTLYAALQQIDSKTKNVLTLEDPVEYQVDGISQTQINTKKGMTFAKGLRNILRQDPDIIMVGEIRDLETAELAIQASLTGHLVFSTLHTNDAASAITRLVDLGVEPFLISSCLLGVLAQRLVRKNCPYCFNKKVKNCDHCKGLGVKGRLGIFEFLKVSDSLRSAIQKQANSVEIKALGKSEGMKELREDGLNKVRQGLTTENEIYRVSSQGE